MAIKIEMPKLSDTMTEGTLVKWHKNIGDSVEIGDIIAEVETDKATMEMEAFDDGTLTQILVKEGEKVPIGGLLAVLDGEVDTGTAPAAPEKEAATPAATPTAGAAPGTPARSSEAADLSGKQRLKASPLARKIAAERGVDLATLSGSGPGGRIVKADVESAGTQAQAAHKLAAAAKTRAAVPAAPPAMAEALLPVQQEGDQIIPLSSMRGIIASRLLISKQTIPHFYLHAEVDMASLMDLRRQINAQTTASNGNKYSVNDFILKAAINAARAVPAANASFAGDHIVQFASVGMAVAVAIDDGLVTPVIKNAETKTLLQISQEVKDLASRAKEKKLKPNEFDGGTITVSNLGAWGIDFFDAIINPPQALIVSVGAVLEKPVVENGQVVPGLRMNLGLSCDHRVVDGAVGASFLAEMKRLLEQPALMLI